MQKDFSGASKSYQSALAILQKVTQSSPTNMEWQADLATGYMSMGQVQLAQGDRASGLKSYDDGIAILERLTQSSPNHVPWLMTLAANYWELAELYHQSNDLKNSMAALLKSKAVTDHVIKLAPDNPVSKRFIAKLDDEIAQLTKEAGAPANPN